MTVRLADDDVRVVLLDIEGTTTPIAFVHDVLFPFARAHLQSWCRDHGASAEFSDVARRLAAEHREDRQRGEPVPPWETESDSSDSEPLVNYALWLMDRDRKSPGLKLLQGLIWEQGYQAGELRGQVYPDVPDAIRRWRRAGYGAAVYSSGSELAQRRLFSSTPHGDLTSEMSGFFDTSVGPKTDAESYARIAERLHQPPDRVLFISDVTRELAAARRAGMKTLLSVRPGNPPQPHASDFQSVSDFDQISTGPSDSGPVRG